MVFDGKLPFGRLVHDSHPEVPVRLVLAKVLHAYLEKLDDELRADRVKNTDILERIVTLEQYDDVELLRKASKGFRLYISPEKTV